MTTLSSSSFHASIDPVNGSLAELVHPDDKAAMNWVTSTRNAPWHPRSFQWGLGFADIGRDTLNRARWEEPDSLKVDEQTGTARVVYRVGPLQIEVTRKIENDAFSERYAFSNNGSAALQLTDRDRPEQALAIYTPFNDHYTTTKDCLERRSHAHIWCGGSSSWVRAPRMGGRAPHLGCVLSEGALLAYSVAGRDRTTWSNTRGIFLLHPEIGALAPGETRAVAWTLFWHDDWDDFFARCARHSPRFVRLEASRYTAFPGEKIAITARGASLQNPKLTANEQSPPLQQDGDIWRATFKAETVGEVTCKFVDDSGLETRIALNISPAIPDLVAARVRFIVERQQVNQPGDPLDGAFLVYDNECEALARKDWGYDRNEARERVGMGVLLARWLRARGARGDPKPRASLAEYYRFVSERLQRKDGYVPNSVFHDKPQMRLYNWPWVMQLHLQMALLTGSEPPLRRFIKTVESFYALGGETFYPIGIPVLESLQTLKSSSDRHANLHRRVLYLFTTHAERLVATGTNYPESEVNFEQSIIAPAAIFLLELHRATGETRWLEAARPHLRLLELFNGRQPDHRLHDIAIRHWDGYWFGKAMMWGDTFPHYWSTLTALAFHHYAKITGEADYARRAEEIIRNNLSLFSPDGRASCAFIYPFTVNGQRAHFADPYANDQDWALAHALQIAQEQPE